MMKLIRYTTITFLMIAGFNIRCAKDRAEKDGIGFRFDVVDSAYVVIKGDKAKIETINLRASSGIQKQYSDTITSPYQIHIAHLIDSGTNSIYFNEFSWKIHRLSMQDGSSLGEVLMPAMALSDHRRRNVPTFTKYKKYIFLSCAFDLVILSDDLKYGVALSSESEKGRPEKYGFPNVINISYSARNDTLKLITTILTDQDDQYMRDSICHDIYLPHDPKDINLSSYRIYGRDFSGIRLPEKATEGAY